MKDFKDFLQEELRSISHSHFWILKEEEKIKKELELKPKDTELEKRLIFLSRMRNQSVEEISLVIHEAVRQKASFRIKNLSELLAFTDFFIERGIEGHKVIADSLECITQQPCYKRFIKAYCSENRNAMKRLKSEILKE